MGDIILFSTGRVGEECVPISRRQERKGRKGGSEEEQ